MLERLDHRLEEVPIGLVRQPHERVLQIDDVLQLCAQGVGVGALRLPGFMGPAALRPQAQGILIPSVLGTDDRK